MTVQLLHVSDPHFGGLADVGQVEALEAMIPDLRPDTNIELGGMGKAFNRTYYVEQTTHTLSAAGYRTTFRVKETTI